MPLRSTLDENIGDIHSLAGKRKLQQHVESACDKLQAVRSSDNNSTGAFGWDVENYMLDLQADIKCIGVLGVPAGTGRVGTGEPQQQLKFRLSKTHKKTLVESHPIAGTLSDVLQESKSTQSAMNIAINDDNLGEGVPCPLPESVHVCIRACPRVCRSVCALHSHWLVALSVVAANRSSMNRSLRCGKLHLLCYVCACSLCVQILKPSEIHIQLCHLGPAQRQRWIKRRPWIIVLPV